MRKGDMSINVIVVIAIALIVLLVLTIIFLGRGKVFTQGLSQCKGECVKRGNPCPNANSATVPSPNCDDGRKAPIEDGICCIQV
jgi:hypothetical protein